MSTTTKTGLLAARFGYRLPLLVLQSGAGYYLGTIDPESGPVSRESVEYWPRRDLAEKALAGSEGTDWTQRTHP